MIIDPVMTRTEVTAETIFDDQDMDTTFAQDPVPEPVHERADEPYRAHDPFDFDHTLTDIVNNNHGTVTDEKSEIETTTLDETKMKTMTNCLFPTCVQCTNMILIEFQDSFMLDFAKGSEKMDTNVVVLTKCTTCMNETRRRSVEKTGDPCRDAFDVLSMHPSMFKNSMMMKVANKIVGRDVLLAETKMKTLYMSIDEIREMTLFECKFRSLNMPKTFDESETEYLLPYMLSGFL